jgi:hypothetical protein
MPGYPRKLGNRGNAAFRYTPPSIDRRRGDAELLGEIGDTKFLADSRNNALRTGHHSPRLDQKCAFGPLLAKLQLTRCAVMPQG